MYKITHVKRITDTIVAMDVEAPLVAKVAKAGQFIILRIDETGERIPLTISDYDREKGSIALIIQVVGKTTAKLYGLEAGDTLLDFVGPLGLPTHVAKWGTVVCIGGGVGTAPVYPQAREFKKAGNKVISIVGARNLESLIYEEQMAAVSDELIIATDDGSKGHHGFVTQVLQQLIDRGEQIDHVVAIGPLPMMRAVCQITREHQYKTSVSLNSIMVDGTGMCGCCRVKVDDEMRFACVDGPDFDGLTVDFDELMMRQRRFIPEEKMAFDLYQQSDCRGGCQNCKK